MKMTKMAYIYLFGVYLKIVGMVLGKNNQKMKIKKSNYLSDFQFIACVFWSISIIEYSLVRASWSGDEIAG